jgi:hypothetical protein
MPKRSNDFQKLIKLIEQQLAPSATVEESAMLPDTHDGTLREVDILIRSHIGERELRVGIECRDHKRKADLPWIEQIHSKYEHLDVDRVVAVSRKGFSDAARAKAKLWGIELMTLAAAERQDWSNRLHRVGSMKLIVERLSFEPPYSFELVSPDKNEASFALDSEMTVFTPGRGTEPLRQFLHETFGQEQIRSSMLEKGKERGKEVFRANVQFPPGSRITNAEGRTLTIRAMKLGVRVRATDGLADMKFAEYGPTGVAHGSGKAGDIPFTVSYTQKSGGAVHGQAVIHVDGKDVSFGLPEPFPDSVPRETGRARWQMTAVRKVRTFWLSI